MADLLQSGQTGELAIHSKAVASHNSDETHSSPFQRMLANDTQSNMGDENGPHTPLEAFLSQIEGIDMLSEGLKGQRPIEVQGERLEGASLQELSDSLLLSTQSEDLRSVEELLAYGQALVTEWEDYVGATMDGESSHPYVNLVAQLPAHVMQAMGTTGSTEGGDQPLLQQGPLKQWAFVLQSLQRNTTAQQANHGPNRTANIINMVDLRHTVEAAVQQWKQHPQALKKLAESLNKIESPAQIEQNVAVQKSWRQPSFLPVSLLNQITHNQKQGATTSDAEGSRATDKAVVEGYIRAPDQKIATVGARQTEGEHTNARFNHLLQDVREILSTRVSQGISREGSELRVRLHPEHLGHLDIRLTSIEGKVNAQIMASSLVAKDALETGLSQLRLALLNQGIQVERIDVSQQSQSQQSHEQRQSQQAMQQHQEQGHQQQGHQDQEQVPNRTDGPVNDYTTVSTESYAAEDAFLGHEQDLNINFTV
ncbi:flagellar hook-length control protein FliK [Caldalkalibacillus salinus]|uniref:flagellar hook-length control protein FliK n=1 Tax=Caldalkalibacillus salinus TaxID=2803787 RepID=UPI001920AD1A|nr:flagellar hook-length control protein FliK [Caldalkalibacillus salinus]